MGKRYPKQKVSQNVSAWVLTNFYITSQIPCAIQSMNEHFYKSRQQYYTNTRIHLAGSVEMQDEIEFLSD